MIEIIEGLSNNVVGIAVKGRVTKKDCYDVLMPAMKKSLKRHDKIRLTTSSIRDFRAPRGTISKLGSSMSRRASGSRL
jgi:hypothetical protein